MYYIIMGQCKIQMADYCFRVRKQWDYCCHIFIYREKTVVHSQRFTLTDYNYNKKYE